MVCKSWGHGGVNYAVKILNYLASQDGFSQVLLAAGAPPIDKRNRDIHIVINAVLAPDDIRDTLATFASHVRRTGVPDLGHQGVFAFGLPNLGRFRVHHLTQRGSDLVAIQKVPFGVPPLETLLKEPSAIPALDALMAPDPTGGIILVVGPSAAGNVQFAYSLLARVNDRENRVLLILEQNLSFLLGHKNSVVIQIEAGTDIPTIAEGLQSGLLLSPDILYVKDAKTRGEILGAMTAAEAGSLVVASAVAFSEKYFLADLQARLEEEYDSFCRLLRRVIRVSLDVTGKIGLNMLEVQVDVAGRAALQPS
jgi:twitching motility protein PilT